MLELLIAVVFRALKSNSSEMFFASNVLPWREVYIRLTFFGILNKRDLPLFLYLPIVTEGSLIAWPLSFSSIGWLISKIHGLFQLYLILQRLETLFKPAFDVTILIFLSSTDERRSTRAVHFFNLNLLLLKFQQLLILEFSCKSFSSIVLTSNFRCFRLFLFINYHL